MKKRRVLIVLVLALLLAALLYRVYTNASLLPGQLNGTFVLGHTLNSQLIFSVNTAEEVFYFTDQWNSRYITGRVTPQGDGAYSLACQDPDNAAVLPDQIIACDDLTLLLRIYDLTLPFQKTDHIPLQIGNNYS